MKIIKLKPNKDGIVFFSNIYTAPDHNSGYRDYYTLFQTLTLWNSGSYHVYVAMEGDTVLGCLHGRDLKVYETIDFDGDFYFFKECRGRIALEALELTVEQIRKDLGVTRFFADILEHNKPAKILVSAAGFKRFKKDKYILEIK